MDDTEAKIVSAIIASAFALDYVVSIYDGEEWSLKRSGDEDCVTAEIAATDMTIMSFRDSDGARIGQVLLVHGNGTDLVSDHTDCPEMVDLLADAETLAEALDAAYWARQGVA